METLKIILLLALQFSGNDGLSNENNVLRLHGNVTVGGLVPIYPLDHDGKCNYESFQGAFGMLRLEAMIYSVNEVSFGIINFTFASLDHLFSFLISHKSLTFLDKQKRQSPSSKPWLRDKR